MKYMSDHARYALYISSIILLIFLVSCGGGGGGGGNESGEGEGLTASDYTYGLDLDLTGNGITPFQIKTTVGEATEATVSFAGVPGNPLGDDFIGTIHLAKENNETVISSITVDDTTVFYINVTGLWDSPTLKITVLEPIVFEGGDDPSSGSFKVENGLGDPSVVSFTKTGGNFLVNISGIQDPIQLDEFKDSLETSTDTLQQQLSVAYHMIEMLYDQVIFSASMIIKIDNEDLGTEQGNANAGLPDSTGGTLTLSCTSGSIMPGANFSVVFNNFWQDDPDDNIDTLIDGSVSLKGYLRNETNDKLVNTGFAWGDGAGVFYSTDGVDFYETENTGSGLNIELTHTLYGSYSIVFSVL